MRKNNKEKKILLLITIWSSSIQGTGQDYKPNIVVGVNEKTQDMVLAATQAIANTGSNICIKEIPDIPVNLSVTSQTFERFSQFARLVTALSFTLLGGFIFKSGLDNIGDKDKKSASIAKILAGLAISSLSLLYIHKYHI